MANGFVDLQVNGYLGVDFSAPDLTVEKVHFVTKELVKRGTVAYCPTVITSTMEVYQENLPIIATAMEDPELGPHILGIHLEGPFISSADGARGAHVKDWIRPPDIKLYDKFQDLAAGKIIILTLAPELQGAEELIKHITRDGTVTVSLGHHLANKVQIEKACRAGARACTHLGNGIPNLIARHTNPIWPQLAEDSLFGMFICDGHHLPVEFIKVALRAKTTKRFIVVSDSASIAGLSPGTYEIWGQKIVLEENGRLVSIDSGYLAGSSSNMSQCMNFLASTNLLNENELWEVGFVNPLKLINKNAEEVRDLPGPEIKFVDNKFVVENTITT